MNGGHYYAYIRPTLSDEWYTLFNLSLFCICIIMFILVIIGALVDCHETSNVMKFITIKDNICHYETGKSESYVLKSFSVVNVFNLTCKSIIDNHFKRNMDDNEEYP